MALTNAAPDFDGFRPPAKVQINKGSATHKTVLQTLLMHCLKKQSETDKNLKLRRARKRTHEDFEANKVECEEESDVAPEGKKAVSISLIDLEVPAHRMAAGGWNWDMRGARKLGILVDPIVDAIWKVVSNYIPIGDYVHEIFGALQNLQPATYELADW